MPLLLMMVCLFLGGMDGEDSPDGAIPEVTSRHPPWTYEEIAERSAAVWEDGSWNSPWSAPTWNSSLAENVVGGEMTATAEVHGMISSFPPMASSSSSSASAPAHEFWSAGSTMPPHSAWDENISVGLQEEEVQRALASVELSRPLAPIPEEVPPPFGLPGTQSSLESPARQDAYTGEASSGNPGGSTDMDLDEEAWDRLRDRRPLRGQPPAQALHLPVLPHGRDPASLTTPKAKGATSSLAPGEIDWSSPTRQESHSVARRSGRALTGGITRMGQ